MSRPHLRIDTVKPTLRDHISLNEAAERTKAYPQLLRSLCEHYEIPLVQRGSRTWVPVAELTELTWRVLEWRQRPKLSRPSNLRGARRRCAAVARVPV